MFFGIKRRPGARSALDLLVYPKTYGLYALECEIPNIKKRATKRVRRTYQFGGRGYFCKHERIRRTRMKVKHCSSKTSGMKKRFSAVKVLQVKNRERIYPASPDWNLLGRGPSSRSTFAKTGSCYPGFVGARLARFCRNATELGCMEFGE
ncbi:hypothetical protein CsSME_00053754 [Camellia sinensis var. sinensis]